MACIYSSNHSPGYVLGEVVDAWEVTQFGNDHEFGTSGLSAYQPSGERELVKATTSCASVAHFKPSSILIFNEDAVRHVQPYAEQNSRARACKISQSSQISKQVDQKAVRLTIRATTNPASNALVTQTQAQGLTIMSDNECDEYCQEHRSARDSSHSYDSSNQRQNHRKPGSGRWWERISDEDFKLGHVIEDTVVNEGSRVVFGNANPTKDYRSHVVVRTTVSNAVAFFGDGFGSSIPQATASEPKLARSQTLSVTESRQSNIQHQDNSPPSRTQSMPLMEDNDNVSLEAMRNQRLRHFEQLNRGSNTVLVSERKEAVVPNSRTSFRGQGNRLDRG